MKQLILVVDGSEQTPSLTQRWLEDAGYEVGVCASTDAISESETRRPSLILISAAQAESIGIMLCRHIRQSPILAKTPILFLLTDDAAEYRVLALEAGADDCIKAGSPRELVARVQAVLRRFLGSAGASTSSATDLLIDSWAMKVSVRGNEISTTSLEFRLIEYLARHRGQVFTRDLLLDAVWGDMQFITPRSVDACIRRIREKIEPDRSRPTYLKTIRGVGYRLDAVAAWQTANTEGCDCIACTSAIGGSKLAYVGAARRRRSAAHQ